MKPHAVATAALGVLLNACIGVAPPEPGTDDGPRPGAPDSGSGGDSVCNSVALAPACTADWYADGECDPANNAAECEWDGGDCCAQTCTDAGCGDFGFDCRDPEAGGSGDPEPQPLGSACGAIDDPFAPQQLESETALLSSDALAGRRPGTIHDLTTRQYVEERFQCLGLTPAANGCFQQAFHNDDGDPTANVIGTIPGSDPSLSDEIIIIGAHHDHLGVIDGQAHNGANDNVSGLVALMAIADQVLRSPTPPRRTLVFIAFGSEETGLEGSRYYVTHTPAGLDMDDVVYMINLDMLGTYDVAGGVDGFGTFAGTPGRAVLENVLQDHPQLDVTLGVASPDDDSDYDPFCESEIPYVYFETFDEPCWHEACDDAPRMDFAHMAELVEVLHGVTVALADSDIDLRASRAEHGCARESAISARRTEPSCHASIDIGPGALSLAQATAGRPRTKRRALYRAMHAH